MGIDKIIIIIMTIFMAIGGIDKIFGNKLGYGEKFEEGIMAMGSLAVAMVGIITLAPVLKKSFNTNSRTNLFSIRSRSGYVCNNTSCK